MLNYQRVMTFTVLHVWEFHSSSSENSWYVHIVNMYALCLGQWFVRPLFSNTLPQYNLSCWGSQPLYHHQKAVFNSFKIGKMQRPLSKQNNHRAELVDPLSVDSSGLCYPLLPNILAGWWAGTWLLLHIILGILIPTDFHIFQSGWNHQPD